MKSITNLRIVVVLSILTLAGFTLRPADSIAARKDVETVLDDFNRAATNADVDAYFACFAPDGVFIGTDATERWTVDELRTVIEPYFDRGQTRTHTPHDRHVDFCPGGTVAYFDELVDIESLGECRGTGVVIKVDDAWLITQYSLSFPIPNAIVFDVVDRIRVHGEEQGTSSTTGDAAVRATLDAYLATVSYPGPAKIDPESFATDIEAFWSSGDRYHGRASVVHALEAAQEEFEVFESFAATPEQVRIHRRGDMAWLMCRIRMNGTFKDGGGPFTRTIRSTFVFVRPGDRWQMIQEHSSLVPDG